MPLEFLAAHVSSSRRAGLRHRPRVQAPGGAVRVPERGDCGAPSTRAGCGGVWRAGSTAAVHRQPTLCNTGGNPRCGEDTRGGGGVSSDRQSSDLS